MNASPRSLGSPVQGATDSELPPPVNAPHAEEGAGRYSMVAPRPARARTRPRRPLTVLVLEADESTGRYMIDILTLSGHAPMHARTIDEARLRLEEARFDVVLLDLQLEGESSTDLLGDLTQGVNRPAIVVVSAYRLAEPIAKEHGVAFVRKPFEVSELTSAIEHSVFDRPSIAP